MARQGLIRGASFGTLALFLLSGCALLPVGGEPTSSPGGDPSPMRAGLNDYRASFHCHCFLSHDSEGTTEEIAGAANALGLNAILLTDHYEPGNVSASPQGIVDGVLFVPGLEEGLPHTKGSFMGVGLTEELDTSRPKHTWPARVREQGAFLVAGHVEGISEQFDLSGFAGFEVYNLHAEAKAATKLTMLLGVILSPPDPLLEQLITTPTETLARWDRELAKGHRLVPLAGHDAHANVRLFGATLGTYPEIFRLFSTHVLAAELSEEAIMDGLRAGHTYVAFDYLGDPKGFSVTVDPGSGTAQAILGESVRWTPASRLQVRVPERARIRVLRDGQVWRRRTGHRLSARLPGPGIYRVEVYKKPGPARERLWILASPVYVVDGA